MTEFERSLAKTLVHEGAFSNHPKDPGGATMKGVTQRVYDTYRDGVKLPRRTVKLISQLELRAIYFDRYWKLIKGDNLPPGVSYVVFDGAVNSGVSQSVKWLQRALGVQADGVIGPATLTAVAGVNDHDALVVRICERRMAFLKALKTWKTFGKGWKSRVDGVRAVGTAWANGSIGPEVKYVEGGDAKAYVEDAKAAPGKGVADAATGGGVGAGGLAGTLQTAQEQLTPYASSAGWIQTLVAVLIVSGVALTAGGLAWRWYANKKKAELADALDTVPA